MMRIAKERSKHLARLTLLLLLSLSLVVPGASAECPVHSLPKLQVSDNGRFLMQEGGTPFFYLAEDVFFNLSLLPRAELDIYFTDRVNKRFNVVQTLLVGGNLHRPDVFGELPFLTVNPNQPYNSSTNPYDPTQPNEAYFENMDYVIERAEHYGMYVAVAPIWGTQVVAQNSIFNEVNARIYGEFVGERYRDKPIIWLLGADSNGVQSGIDYVPFWRALAEGLKVGDQGNHLITYHPQGGARSARWFHDESWLDFNMNQSGHSRYPTPNTMVALLRANYNAQPAKPTIDGESGFENIPEGLSKGGTRDMFDSVDEADRLSAYEIRARAYWNVFSGAFGHAYGANGVYQLTRDGAPDSWRWDPGMTWQDALQLPGSSQMQYVRNLMEARPYFTRIPDQSIIASGNTGTHYEQILATRDSEGSYAMIYMAVGQSVSIHMDMISGRRVKAYWYDPRTGDTIYIGKYRTQGMREFTPPTTGAGNDWILLLDDASKKFGHIEHP